MKNKTNVWHLLSKIFFCVSLGLFVFGILMMLLYDMFFGAIYAGIGGMFFLFALGMFLFYKNGEDKKQSLLAAGNYVMADIIDIDVYVNQTVQMGTMKIHPYYILCRYIDENGREYIFKSNNLYYNPSGLLKSPQLRVYVDMAAPNKYYVDTDSILPGNAVLHKWKFDTKGNEKLIESGDCLQATTCGVEHHGRIRVSGMCLPHFVKMSEELAAKLNMGLDEKDRAFLGYTILCRYDAPDGTPHIFASKLLLGDPASDYMDMPIKVYCSGKNYKNHHVDIRGLGIYE